MKRATWLLACLAALLVTLGAACTSTASAKGPCGKKGSCTRPVISNLLATPATVPSGGSTTVSASVTGATGCTLSSNKPVAGLPDSFSCGSGSVEVEISMPANTGRKAVKYKLTLTATGADGKAKKAKTKVSVSAAT